MNFKEWLTIVEDTKRSGAKLGLYPDIVNLMGQHPPLYGMPHAADYITYLYIKYGKDGPPSENGIIKVKPGRNVTDRYLPPE
jgi:hypothetical protein